MKIKEMVYTTKHITELLGHGVYNGYEYAIVSRGTHPCAYVRLPKDHSYYGIDEDCMPLECIPIDCHGYVTYADDYLDVMLEHSGWWIGWDYAHLGLGDYYAGEYICADGKKWTYSEIFEEVKQVIEQLKNLQKPEGKQ